QVVVDSAGPVRATEASRGGAGRPLAPNRLAHGLEYRVEPDTAEGRLEGYVMEELWRDIEGWPYQVSDLGRVRRMGKDRVLKPFLMGRDRNRPMVTLWNSGGDGRRRRHVLVHLLVATEFIGPRPEGMVICHINSDPHDNRACNLRYGTVAENELDKRLPSQYRGNLSYEDYLDIRD